MFRAPSVKLLIILLCSEPLLKLLIPSLHVGHVLGKGGSYVNELRSTYKGHIAFSPAQPLYPGTEDRVCLLTGTVQQITDLSYQILNRVRSGNCYFKKFKPHSPLIPFEIKGVLSLGSQSNVSLMHKPFWLLYDTRIG